MTVSLARSGPESPCDLTYGDTTMQDAVIEEIRGIHAGGGFGSIIGRNSFQRPRPDALALLNEVMDIYAS